MKFLGRLIYHLFSNAIAILAADYFLTGFIFTGDFPKLLIAAGVLTLINTFLRPILKLLLGPLIILTLGLFLIIINAISLYLLDLWSNEVTIKGFTNLIFATLIVGFLNFLITLGAKGEKKK